MMLLIDAGNTRVKVGRAGSPDGRRDAGFVALAHTELDRLPAWLATLPARPGAAIGVNVAGAAMGARIEALCGVPVRWVAATAEAGGVVNLYDDPSQLGTDRWVSMIGLAKRTSTAAVLASFGTATTVDTLSPCPAEGCSRRFEGGLILPGPELMRHSLATGTAGLPYAEGGGALFPRNTHAAISSGIVAAQAGAVLRQWRAAVATLGTVPQLYCSGGAWPLVCEEITGSLARIQADLGLPAVAPEWLDAPVLDGLAALAAAG